MGNIIINKGYIGNSIVDKIYIGNELLYRKIDKGIYILGISGKLYKRTEWFNNESSVGVAVVTDTCEFVIAPTQTTASGILPWNRNGIVLLIDGVTTSTVENEAIKDFLGPQNTSNIINYYGSYSDYSAGWCTNYTFRNGQKGYLGSVGEWKEAYNNKTEIDACMSLINGTAIDTTYHFATSTQCDSNKTWGMYWSNGKLYKLDKSDNSNVRAFSKLP